MDVSLNFRVLDCMTTVVDNLLECITIEICKEKHKNVIISCIYIGLLGLALKYLRTG